MLTSKSSQSAQTQRLTEFFACQRALAKPASDDALVSRLRNFLSAASNIDPPRREFRFSSTRPIDIDRARTMFAALALQVPLHRKDHNLLDIWSVTGLKRNEVRNAAVLAWLLNPRGSHGQGAMFLEAVLQPVAAAAAVNLGFCNLTNAFVQTEHRPLGSDRDRVDIAIQADGLLMFIEVKIDAPEGDQQVDRYREAVKQKADVLCNFSEMPCRTVVVYLAPFRKFSATPDMMSLTWKDIAKMLIAVSHKVPPLVAMLVRSFANHVRKF